MDNQAPATPAVNVQHATNTAVLLFAVQQNNEAATANLLSIGGININERFSNQWTLLFIAVLRGFSGIVQQLLAKEEIDVNATSNTGESPLLMASRKGDVDIVDMLLAHKDIIVDLENINGRTALIEAAHNGYSKIVEALINKGADINKYDRARQFSVLMSAVQYERFEVLKILLEQDGLNINHKNLSGKTAAMLAGPNLVAGLEQHILEKLQLKNESEGGSVVLSQRLGDNRNSFLKNIGSTDQKDKPACEVDVAGLKNGF